MHIPDNYLSPETCAVMTAAMVPVWVHAVRKVKKEVPREKMPILGVGAAFSFTGMMFNIPLPGGTTGHAVGGTLNALLLGPEAACISVTIALLIQALLFGDGGILAFGANCFNMAFVLPFAGYAVYLLLKRIKCSDYLAAAIGSYIGINAAALCTAIEFGIQPYLFHDASGQALYCPYGLAISFPAMMIGHLTLFGAAEVIFTTAIYLFINKTSPSLMQRRESGSMADISISHCNESGIYHGKESSDEEKTSASKGRSSSPVYILLGALILAVPLGLLATGTAWGEWDTSEIGIDARFDFASLFPDYSISGLPDFAGYILSAIIGVSLLIIIFRLIGASMKSKTDYS